MVMEPSRTTPDNDEVDMRRCMLSEEDLRPYRWRILGAASTAISAQKT